MDDALSMRVNLESVCKFVAQMIKDTPSPNQTSGSSLKKKRLKHGCNLG